MTPTESFRNLPSVDGVLKHDDLTAIKVTFSRSEVVRWIRHAVNECRDAISGGAVLSRHQAFNSVLTNTLAQAVMEGGRRQQSVINATGILLHTNLGRSPLADRAVRRLVSSTGYTNVEMNLHTGRRNERGERVVELLRELTGAEDAAIVNNCAAATMLVLQAMAKGREVIVSRGQLVEIGGGYRLPEVFAASGATLKEIGTTNRTYLRDYENAISDSTGSIIRVHRSNFYQGGFVTEPDIEELVKLGIDRGVPVIDDLGSGCIQDLSQFGLQEPTVVRSVAAGASVSLFSGDKLFGGPQAGLIVGKRSWIDRIRSSPLSRAFRVDKMTIAALEATAEIHLSGNAWNELPLLQMLSKPAEAIKAACHFVRDHVEYNGDAVVDIVECVSQIGGGSVPGSQINSYGLKITEVNCDELAASFRRGSPAVLSRIQNDALLLDLRTVPESQWHDMPRYISLILNQYDSEKLTT